MEKYYLNIDETCITLNRLSVLFSPYVFDILNFKNINLEYYYSIITEILIHFKDLTIKLDKIGNRINFKDDITPMNGFDDITGLVAFFRDAACHNDSGKRINSKGKIFSANVFAAYDYEDDITLLTGDAKLLVRRHMFRLYKEIIFKFSTYVELYNNIDFCAALNNFHYQFGLKNNK